MNDPATVVPSFRCRRATVHFIYSMAVSGEIANLPQGWAPGVPSSRIGIVPHLSLIPDSMWYSAQGGRRATVRSKNDSDKYILGSIESLIRVFPGSAVQSLVFQSEESSATGYTKDDLLTILNLTLQSAQTGKQPHSEIMFENKNGPRTLYECFREEAENLPLGWVDRDEQVMNISTETQSPWVVTIAEVDDEIAATFCSSADVGDDPARTKMLGVRRYEADIAPILFRSVGRSGLVLEPAYVQSPTPASLPGLFSSNLDARLFVSMSRRAILCICQNKQEDPAAYFLPGLLDICEQVRARWHSLVVLNKLFDRTIGMVKARRSERQEIRRRLLEMRRRLADSLADQTLYIVAGDALSKLYAELRDIFRLQELRSTLFDKMDLVDKVHRDMQELEWLEAREASESLAEKDI